MPELQQMYLHSEVRKVPRFYGNVEGHLSKLDKSLPLLQQSTLYEHFRRLENRIKWGMRDIFPLVEEVFGPFYATYKAKSQRPVATMSSHPKHKINSILLKEKIYIQRLIYYTWKVFNDGESRYHLIKKFATC